MFRSGLCEFRKQSAKPTSDLTIRMSHQQICVGLPRIVLARLGRSQRRLGEKKRFFALLLESAALADGMVHPSAFDVRRQTRQSCLPAENGEGDLLLAQQLTSSLQISRRNILRRRNISIGKILT